jgi:hypothetical protein
MNETTSWIRTALTVLLIPLLLALCSNYFIPNIIEKSNKTEALRTAKLKRALDIRDRNDDFTTKLHRLKTMMQTFNNQNIRRRLSGLQLRERQDAFQKEYTDHYLSLDETAWWWYWDLERDAEVLNLLSPEDLKTLGDLITKYGVNVASCIGAVDPLWRYLSSADYSSTKDSQRQFNDLEKKMNQDINNLYQQRVLLIKDMSTLFAKSQYESKH